MLGDRRTAQTRHNHKTGLWIAELAAGALCAILVANLVESAELKGNYLSVDGFDAVVVTRNIRGNATAEAGTPQTNTTRVTLRLRLEPVDNVRKVLDLREWIEDLAQLEHLGGEAIAGPLAGLPTREDHAAVAFAPASIIE